MTIARNVVAIKGELDEYRNHRHHGANRRTFEKRKKTIGGALQKTDSLRPRQRR
jgi:hypothetical protein